MIDSVSSHRTFAFTAITVLSTMFVPHTKAAEAPTTYTYKKVGDLEIKADVYGAAPGQMRPVLVWIHGGALIGGNRTGMDRRICNPMLEAGCVVVSIDYRLAPETMLPEIIAD